MGIGFGGSTKLGVIPSQGAPSNDLCTKGRCHTTQLSFFEPEQFAGVEPAHSMATLNAQQHASFVYVETA